MLSEKTVTEHEVFADPIAISNDEAFADGIAAIQAQLLRLRVFYPGWQDDPLVLKWMGEAAIMWEFADLDDLRRFWWVLSQKRIDWSMPPIVREIRIGPAIATQKHHPQRQSA